MTLPTDRPESTRMPGPVGSTQIDDGAAGGQEPARGILGVDADLDGVPVEGDVVLG